MDVMDDDWRFQTKQSGEVLDFSLDIFPDMIDLIFTHGEILQGCSNL